MIAFVFGLIVDRVIAHADRTRRADEIAHWCASAYSFDAFGPTEWRRAARMMAARGYSNLGRSRAPVEVDAVESGRGERLHRDGQGPGPVPRPADPYALRQLVRETFPEDPRR